ncbi:hypothetical protein KDA_27610 [Dictyobacter alpinus]|uniref:histidine kinase n=1 Tax=Dictyobacter alpinus TaxID=2014873 RepID=A0A402B7H9_9CHLR|nr:ATP-binding protein [Dictyobacter alpinus]GCE27277.1 hypothetical protein KDA_27610 [Dictyobacter alpinus]
MSMQPGVLFEAIFASLPDAVVVCDQEGSILHINAPALKLLELSSELRWQGKPLRELLQHYTLSDEQQHPIALASWLQSLSLDEMAVSGACEQTIMLRLPSGWTFSLNLCCSLLLDAHQQLIGTILVFHHISPHYQKALHLQRVQQAVRALNTAISNIPANIDFTFSQETPLLSPPMLFVAKQLVDMIRQVLNCWRVSLLALEPQTLRIYHAIGSGFTPEQEEGRRGVDGRFIYSDFTDKRIHDQLCADQEVIISTDRLRVPKDFPQDLITPATILGIPLLIEQQLVGAIVIYKAGWDSYYSQEEVELVRAVAAQALLIIQYLSCLHRRTGQQTRTLVEHEVHHLINELLTLASHELRTPLTGIKGNLQLAQRRLAKVKLQISGQTSPANEQIAQAEEPLAEAVASARIQERMIQDMIDDTRIQANTLTLSLKPCDLLALIQAVVTSKQQAAPDQTITLENLTTAATIPIMADAERITQVLSIYLTNALTHSPAGQSVTVRVQVEDAVARISVHDEGEGIPIEEQVHLWERFYRGKGSAVQHELDLSLGLSFYLCQALIDRHHGRVGVESNVGHGTTFWFTLPCSASGSLPTGEVE